MERLLILLLFFGTPLIAFGQKSQLSVKHSVSMNLKGQVQEVRNYAFEPGGKESDTVNLVPYDFFGMLNFIVQFDRQGWKVKKIDLKLHDSKLVPSATWSYRYDSLHRLIEETYIFKSIDQTDTASFHYLYPSTNHTTIIEKRNSEMRMAYHHKLENRTEEVTTVNSDSSYIARKYFQFDEQERIIKVEDYGNESRLRNLTINFFGSDSYRNPAKVLETDLRTGKTFLSENELDVFGNVVGKKISSVESGESRTTTFTYSYDELGNWIEQKEFIDGVLRKVFKREIVYYED
ncbi:hypothetical protein C943_00464 [Mariniradius saccharolyticus AK6]|uniref:YD repeat-containing protein n=1 Tax=Mariniradius saccharolyticus AK6 TaxID=1239962 RepID=M7XXF8_9BACT|nr:hypothetical protein [Mariniradius saccharolyticus]EMS33187.1 hypothetical protein C943_00464 [Mariniradius saccharolyticus AK6]